MIQTLLFIPKEILTILLYFAFIFKQQTNIQSLFWNFLKLNDFDFSIYCHKTVIINRKNIGQKYFQTL